LRKISGLNGLLGINSFNEFVHKDLEKQTIEMLVNHVAHAADIMGVDHVGIGMDYCDFLDEDSMNGFSSQQTSYTKGLEDASKTYNIIIELKKAGFSRDEIEKIAYKNFHRIIKDITR